MEHQKPKLLLTSPHMGGDEMKYIQLAFDSNWIAPLGANVTCFEEEICRYTGAKHATALSSGTAALHLALLVGGVKPGDTVFCQSLTFSASANPIIYVGAQPVFLDSEADTWNLDPEVLRKAIREHGCPKALIFVHLYGTPARAEEIREICEENHILLIEDAAEALGSTCCSKSCGTIGDYGIFSFNGNKIITTSGGGMLLSKAEQAAEHALKLATQARENAPWYQHEEIGYNYRLSNVCAGIGRGQMHVLTLRIAQKREIFRRYREALAELPIYWAKELPGCTANRWLSVLCIDEHASTTPTQLLHALEQNSIVGRPMWKPMHLQPVFAGAPYVKLEERSVSDGLFERGVCLPSDTKMTPEQQADVIEIIKSQF